MQSMKKPSKDEYVMNNHRNYQICSNCVMDTTDSEISFDERGFCGSLSDIL